MVALYLFCAALGIPLLALFAFGGSDGDAEIGDAGFDVDADVGADLDLDLGGADGGIGDITALFRRVPVSSYAFFLSFFGAMGLIGTWLDFGTVSAFVLAVVMGVLSAGVNSAAFAFLRNTDTSSHMTDRDLEGRLATVSVPIEAGHRGRVWIDTGDERVQLTASAVEQEADHVFARGEHVVIVGVEHGIAHVMRAGPELTE